METHRLNFTSGINSGGVLISSGISLRLGHRGPEVEDTINPDLRLSIAIPLHNEESVLPELLSVTARLCTSGGRFM